MFHISVKCSSVSLSGDSIAILIRCESVPSDKEFRRRVLNFMWENFFLLNQYNLAGLSRLRLGNIATSECITCGEFFQLQVCALFRLLYKQ